ncbi:unnamed protein product [Cladocopium goreaui]|uniref:DDE-1 domain-containing protein n=1 Tax=Cladocopium goreaui TaxID=2562237 RepID=A0A9P1G810_9DINO|nr:unnamed protein product [Cladocopium goreaui]
MSVAAEAVACLAEKKVTELRAALLLNQRHIRNCQQQSRREAASLLKGGLSCHSERKVLAVYALSNWDLSLALRAAQRLSRVAPSAADVFHYYENKALQVEPCGQPRRRTVNKWAARWRARWGVRRACLRSADTVDPSIFSRVKAFWRSIAYVTEKFGHQELVWINFDETSVPCCPPCPKGCVVNDWKSYPVPGGPQMPVPKSRRRIAYTYGALLCSHPGIQAVLPHFLVCSEKRLPQTVAKGFAALPPTRLRLLRRKSSWVTTDCMIRILADVREVFSFFLCQLPALACYSGEPQQLEFLWQLGQAPREFFASRQWAHAFESVGCGRDVTKLHSALRNFMQNPVSLPLPAKPTPAEMALIWPKRRKMSYADACLF